MRYSGKKTEDIKERKETIDLVLKYVEVLLALLGFINLIILRCWVDSLFFPLLAVVLHLIRKQKIDFSSYKSWKVDIILVFSSAVYTFYFSQMFALIEGIRGREFEEQTSILFSMMYHISKDTPMHWPAYFSLFAALFIIVKAIVKKTKPTIAIVSSLFLFHGFVNYLTIVYRGDFFLFSDLKSLRTAFNVSEGFSFPFGGFFYYFVIPIYFGASILINLKLPLSPTKTNKKEILGYVITFVSMILVFASSYIYICTHEVVQAFKLSSYIRTISSITFLQTIQNDIKKPEGYSDELYQRMLEETGGVDDMSTLSANDYPNIIIIMNESFSDIGATYGIEFESDPLDFWHSLDALPNAEVGMALSSQFGGGTANSEFEYLTSIPVEVIPVNGIAYSNYIYEETESLVSMANDMGYVTLAFHPFSRSGWSRTRVYPLFGFDRITFIEDIEVQEEQLLRTYYSDEATYSYILSQLNSLNEDEQLFAFVVTMQNHSPYGLEYENYTITNYLYNNNPDTQNEINSLNDFLTLTSYSDDALESFLEELENDDEDYVVVMFGDHQPNLPFSSYLESPRGDSRTARIINILSVPYMIWTNSDSGITIDEFNEDREIQTSINYIALDMLSAAGIPYSNYYELVSIQREAIPVINPLIYYNAETSQWIDNEAIRGAVGIMDEVENEETTQSVIDAYRSMQFAIYNQFGD